jgi:hypothetical protein
MSGSMRGYTWTTLIEQRRRWVFDLLREVPMRLGDSAVIHATEKAIRAATTVEELDYIEDLLVAVTARRASEDDVTRRTARAYAARAASEDDDGPGPFRPPSLAGQYDTLKDACGLYFYDGKVYEVKKTRSTERLYARHLTHTGTPPKLVRTYSTGTIYRLDRSNRMTLAQAEGAALAAGACYVCAKPWDYAAETICCAKKFAI